MTVSFFYCHPEASEGPCIFSWAFNGPITYSRFNRISFTP